MRLHPVPVLPLCRRGPALGRRLQRRLSRPVLDA